MSDPIKGLLERIAQSDSVAAAGSLDDIKRETFRQFEGPAGVVKALKDVYDTAESGQVRSKVISDLFTVVVQSEKQAASKGPSEMSDEEIASVMREAVPVFLAEMAREKFGDEYPGKSIGEFLGLSS